MVVVAVMVVVVLVVVMVVVVVVVVLVVVVVVVLAAVVVVVVVLVRVLTRPYRGSFTARSQLKSAEYFPNWVFPIFLNPIKLKNKYYWFLLHTCGYKLQFVYDHLLITMLH